MSSSEKLPSGYSFRRGTFAELQARNSKHFGWIFIFGSILAIVISIRTILETYVNRLPSYYKAYLSENGKLPNQFIDWQLLSSAVRTIDFFYVIFIFSIIAIIGSAIHIIYTCLIARKFATDMVWFVEYKQQIVGSALLLVRTNYTIFANISIIPKHRNQGVGSHLLWNCLENVRLPVYLVYFPHLKIFYERIGFVALPKEEMPKELRFSQLPGMGLLREPIPIDKQPSTSRSLPQGMSIRPLQDLEEQWQIYKTFWYRKPFRKYLLYLLTVIALILSSSFVVVNGIFYIFKAIFGLTSLANFDFYLLNVPFSGIAIACWLILLLVILNRFLVRWQEWLIEQDKHPIGYVHFWNQANYSILLNLYIAPQYQPQDMSRLLLARLYPQITLPMYFPCWRRDKQFYTDLGFTSANYQELPWELKILQLNNQVYLKLTPQAAKHLFTQLPQIIESIRSHQNRQSQNYIEPQVKVKKSRNRKWFWISDIVIYLVMYMLAPLFQLPEIYAELKQQASLENLPSTEILQSWTQKEQIGTLAIAYDNQTLISANLKDKIQIWDINSKNLQKTLSIFSGNIQSLAMSPNNQSLIVGTSTGIIQQWNYKLGTLEKNFSPGHLGEVQTLNISYDAQTLVTGSRNDPVLKVWNLPQGKLQQTINTRGYVLSLAISPDNQTLYIGSFGGVKIWDLRQQKFVQSLAAHSRAVEVIALSADGKLLVTGGQDRNELSEIWMVKVWDAQSLKLLKILPGYSTFLTSLTISHDGQTIMFNDCCSTMLWNWMNNKYISDLDGIQHDAVLSPDGKTLIGVGSDRKTIKVTNLHTVLESSSNTDRLRK
jgi:N-acetylglutamate synthase-like GNAT family acetyltransferase